MTTSTRLQQSRARHERNRAVARKRSGHKNQVQATAYNKQGLTALRSKAIRIVGTS